MSIHTSSMAVVFNTTINFAIGEVFLFGSLSCIVDYRGALHRVAGVGEEALRVRAIASTKKPQPRS